MERLVPLAGAALGVGLGAWGIWLDRTQPLSQAGLWSALHVASLGGVALGLGAWALASGRGSSSPAQRIGLAVAALLAWRVSYFPIMVFSGHVASIAEWVALGVGAPVVVYSVFLLSVVALHAVAGLGVALLLRPPVPLFRAALVPAFAVATVVSFSKAEDLALLPDRAWSLARPVPPVVAGSANPYLPALGSSEISPHVNVMLLAAGVTYATIPDAPWARAVRSVLEHDFNRNPVASTQARVVEHYLAYHASHSRIGCRASADCPMPPAPDVAAP